MNGADNQNYDTEHLLRQARPTEPSDELKERVLDAARDAWAVHPSPALWRIALRRIAVSTAAAVLIVALVNLWSSTVLSRWRSPRGNPITTARHEQPDVELEIAYASPIHRAGMLHRPVETSADMVLDHLRRLDEALQQNELRM